VVQLLVSLTAPRAFRTILDALLYPVPYNEDLHVVIEPGQYRMDPGTLRGDGVLTAARGPGTVVVDGSGEQTLGFEDGRFTLQGLTLRNWHPEGSTPT
jgi:hypothetical protein